MPMGSRSGALPSWSAKIWSSQIPAVSVQEKHKGNRIMLDVSQFMSGEWTVVDPPATSESPNDSSMRGEKKMTKLPDPFQLDD